MRSFVSITVAVFLAVSPLVAQEKDDVVTLKDGRKETGKVQNHDFNAVKIQIDGGGSKVIKAADVESVELISKPKELRDGEAAAQAGRDDEAITKFGAAIANKRLRPVHRQEAYRGLAAAQFRANKADEGLATLKAMLSAEEFPLSCYLESASADVVARSLAADKADDAAAFLEAQITRLARIPEAGSLVDGLKLQRCRILLKKGDDAGAKREALSIAQGGGSGAAEAKALLGELALAAKDTAGAEKLFREALAGSAGAPAKVAAWNGLGEINLQKGLAEKKPDTLKVALMAFLRGVHQYPPAPGETSSGHETALFKAGVSYQAVGELEKAGEAQTRAFNRARELFRRLRDTYPDSSFAEEAKSRLERLGG